MDGHDIHRLWDKLYRISPALQRWDPILKRQIQMVWWWFDTCQILWHYFDRQRSVMRRVRSRRFRECWEGRRPRWGRRGRVAWRSLLLLLLLLFFVDDWQEWRLAELSSSRHLQQNESKTKNWLFRSKYVCLRERSFAKGKNFYPSRVRILTLQNLPFQGKNSYPSRVRMLEGKNSYPLTLKFTLLLWLFFVEK